MILVDFNMVAILTITSYLKRNPTHNLTKLLMRQVVLEGIHSYNKQFRNKYGKMILCCDSATYWRREIFPYYKAGRKKARATTSLDWKFLFDTLDELKLEFRSALPYKLIEIEGAEADDVIATLVQKYNSTEPILIVSSDKDFVQLQKYQGVKQFTPMFKRFMSVANPEAFTKEHIIRGDSGDGIPNFLSSDDTFVVGERQKSINTVKLNEWMQQDPAQFCSTDTMLRGFKRNQQLIDLDYIPKDLQGKIIEAYEDSKPVSKMKMLDYFMDHKLDTFASMLNEF